MTEGEWLGHRPEVESGGCPRSVYIFTSMGIALVAFGLSLAALSIALVALMGSQ